MADQEEIFTTSFLAGRKRIFVDVKENHAGKYLKITRGRNNRPSGSAVVEYRYAEAAAAAVEALEGTELDGRDLRVRAYFSN